MIAQYHIPMPNGLDTMTVEMIKYSFKRIWHICTCPFHSQLEGTVLEYKMKIHFKTHKVGRDNILKNSN